jgi:hypothetical protein
VYNDYGGKDMTDTQDEKSASKPVALYPRQVAIVEAFAQREHRTFSNAIQHIIEEWAKQNEDKAQ